MLTVFLQANEDWKGREALVDSVCGCFLISGSALIYMLHGFLCLPQTKFSDTAEKCCRARSRINNKEAESELFVRAHFNTYVSVGLTAPS